MTLKISVKAGSWQRLSDESDYAENRRYKKIQEKTEYYRYLFGTQFWGNPDYDPVKIAKAKKNLLKYIEQSSDNKYETTIDAIEEGVKYIKLYVRIRKNGYVRRNGEMVLVDEKKFNAFWRKEEEVTKKYNEIISLKEKKEQENKN